MSGSSPTISKEFDLVQAALRVLINDIDEETWFIKTVRLYDSGFSFYLGKIARHANAQRPNPARP
jgi:hypothetical protein